MVKKQKEIQVATQEIQHFMDAIGDGILITDPKGIITDANQTICSILGYDNKKEITGRSTLSLLSPINEQGVPITAKNAAITKSISHGDRINNAIRQFLRKDNRRMWASITTTPLKDKQKKARGSVLVIRDITEDRQQQEYRTDFAHVASHSLRTPLGNMMWAHEYLLSEKAGKLNDTQNEFLKESYRTLKAMNTMVNDLLSVSRLPDKKIKPKLEKICLEQTVEQIIANYTTYAQARNVTVDFVKSSEKHFIKADQRYLPIIIQNILENAIRYSFENTKIILSITQKGDFITLACTNNGIGIPKDKQKFIFAKFFRAPNAVKSEGNGTGLGLYITREMINMNKGEIWFNSVSNKETTFFIKFKKY